jgi:hypothetical protein
MMDGKGGVCDEVILMYMTVVARGDTSLLYTCRIRRMDSNFYVTGKFYYVIETCDDKY